MSYAVSPSAGEPQRLSGPDADAARRSAAEILSREAVTIRRLLNQSGGEPTFQLSAHLTLARAGLAAIDTPTVEFDATCPDDGTPVIYDFSIREYCCAQRCCPPGG
jgi:hypothetical protein